MRTDMSVVVIGKSEKMAKEVGSHNRNPYRMKASDTYDTPERIQQCLSCPRPKCTNCYVTEKRRIQRSTIMYSKRVETREAFFAAYIVGNTDTEIGNILKVSQATAHRWRNELNFPPPVKVSSDERRRIIEEWRQRQE